MRIKLEIDSDFFGGDSVELLTAINQAYKEIVTQTEKISPVLSQYLREISCRCTDPHHSRVKINFSIPISFPRALGSANFEYAGVTGERQIFSHPSSEEVVQAFIHEDKDGQSAKNFWDSRLGQAFLWGIEAGKDNEDVIISQRELEKVADL